MSKSVLCMCYKHKLIRAKGRSFHRVINSTSGNPLPINTGWATIGRPLTAWAELII